jgi:hypothetical protein
MVLPSTLTVAFARGTYQLGPSELLPPKKPVVAKMDRHEALAALFQGHTARTTYVLQRRI